MFDGGLVWLLLGVLAVFGLVYLVTRTKGDARRTSARPPRPRAGDKGSNADDEGETSPLSAKPLTKAPPKPAGSDVLYRINYAGDDDENELTFVGKGADRLAKVLHDEDEEEEEAPRSVHPATVQSLVSDQDADEDPLTGMNSFFLVHATAQTDTGLRRKRNEDSLLVVPKENLFVVADGMGGHRGGELASALAVKTIGEAFQARRFDGPSHAELPKRGSELARALQMANAAILEEAGRRPELKGMGTTVCAARFSPNKQRLYIGHVGDSRCYRLRDGVLKQVTNDHTMADFGVTGPESADLSRAIGIWSTVPIDLVLGVPKPGDVYLLCSDGLTKMLPDDTIANVLRHEEDAKAAVDRLVFFANSRGGKDNITVILVRVVAPPRRSSPAL